MERRIALPYHIESISHHECIKQHSYLHLIQNWSVPNSSKDHDLTKTNRAQIEFTSMSDENSEIASKIKNRDSTHPNQ